METHESGKLKFQFTVDESVVNVNQTLHGAYIAFLVDETTTCALALAHRDNARGVSVEMNISYTRAARLNEIVTIETECKKVGSTLAFLEATFKTSDGKLIATGRHTKFVGGRMSK